MTEIESVFGPVKINGKIVDFRLPCLSEKELNEPLKSMPLKLSEFDSEEMRQHEQLCRAIETSLIEDGFDAILYGTGGPYKGRPSKLDGPELIPVIIVMIGCEKYTITIIDSGDVVVFDKIGNYKPNNAEKIFSVPLHEPTSLELLADFLRTL